jgi:signal transduction histidine kinase
MIPAMSVMAARSTSARAKVPAVRWLPLALAAAAGCLFLAVAASPPEQFQVPPFLDNPFAWSIAPGVWAQQGIDGWQGLLFMAAPVAVTAIGLYLLRWWPYLLAAAGLMAVPGILNDWELTIRYPPALGYVVSLLPTFAYILAIIGVLACAQGLYRASPAWSAVVVALALGARLMGSAMMAGFSWELGSRHPAAWHTALLAAGLAGLVPALRRGRTGDPDAVGPAGGRPGRRARLIVAGALAALVPFLLALLTMQGMASLLGTTWSTLYRHEDAYGDAIGVIAVVAVAVLAVVAGRWALAGTLTASVAQIAAVLPATIAFGALAGDDPLRWLAALSGVTLGALVAGVRWRVPIAAALAVLTALILFIAYDATTRDPEKLVAQHAAIPATAILILCAAVAAAVTGATAPALAAQGALPVVLGPLVGVLAVGGLQAVQVTQEFGAVSTDNVIPAAFLFLVAGLAVSGLGLARLLTARSAERKHAEQIRRESAAAERDRLGRSIHDGVLQVLALVQREGQDLGGHGGELAALAGQQEVALRSLLASEASTAGQASAAAAGQTTADLRGPLQALAGPAVEVATPAQPVELPSAIASEVVAAVMAALDNVRRHAGADARAWILLEEERDGVRVTVRDDGTGFAPGRPAEAAEAGRLGIAQSMRGRIADCDGTTTIDSRPGQGTEVEFWIPRAPQARR